MGPEEHVRPVVPLQLLLEIADQGRVHMLRCYRTGNERGSGDAYESASSHICLFMMLGPDPSRRGGEPEVLGPPTERIVYDDGGLLGRPARLGALPSPPRPGRHGELAVIEQSLPVLGEAGRGSFHRPPSLAQAGSP